MSTLLLGVAIGFCLGVSFGLEVARYWVTRKGG